MGDTTDRPGTPPRGDTHPGGQAGQRTAAPAGVLGPVRAAGPAQVADYVQLDLPMLPTAASQVIGMVEEESTDAAGLAEIVHRDPTLAAGILRVANSAAYRTRVPVASLQQAVSLLGFRAVAEIVIALAVKGRVFQGGEHAARLAALWRHAVASGFFCKAIARQRRANVESAFLCGLLHDVGKPVLLANLERLVGGGLTAGDDASIDPLLKEHAGPIGALLAAEWDLPPSIVSAITFCRTPEGAPEEWRAEVLQTRLADLLASFVIPDHLGETLDEEALRASDAAPQLNIYPDELDALIGLADEAQAVTEGVG